MIVYIFLVCFIFSSTSITRSLLAQQKEEKAEWEQEQEDIFPDKEVGINFEKAVAIPTRTVRELEIKGNRNVSTDVILSKIKLQAGRSFSQDVLSEDIRRLYATGFFSDISVNVEDVEDDIKIIFIVVEKAVISSIEFEGNKNIRSRLLTATIESKIMEILDPGKVRRDSLKIKKLYIDKGWADVDVTYYIQMQDEEQRASVKFIINEGQRVRIKDIKVEGNFAFPDRRILRIIKTRRRTLFSSGFIKRDVLREDVNRIQSFYRSQGFLDVKVDSKIEQKDNLLYLTIIIDEGEKYIIGDITVSGNEIVTEDELISRLNMKTGTIFSEEGLDADIRNIQSYYFERGYISARIRAKTAFNRKTQRMDIGYVIAEGDVYRVRLIDIKGNVKTKDEVIRRELKIYPGDIFDGEKLKKSKERLHNLGYFEEISYQILDIDIPDQKDLVVRVKETKTGEFAIGAGYSTVDGLLGFASITQRNFDLLNWPTFTGGGQILKLYLDIAETRQNYELNFTEPWFLGEPLLFGFDIYDRTRGRGRRAGRGFEERRTGGALRLGQEFLEYTRWDTTYRLEEVEISNIVGIASQALKDEEGTYLISGPELKLSRDTRDNIFNPTKGYTTFVSTRVAGGPFGGDKDYTIYQAGYDIFYSLYPKWVLKLSTRGGYAQAFGDTRNVPIYDRFYAGGGTTIRGYRERAVGPQDILSGDMIGGDVLWLGNIEINFPLFGEHFRGAAFYDAGYVWAKPGDVDFGDIVSGVGVGIRVKTPIGPVNLDIGFPLDTIRGEEKKPQYYFSMAHRF